MCLDKLFCFVLFCFRCFLEGYGLLVKLRLKGNLVSHPGCTTALLCDQCHVTPCVPFPGSTGREAARFPRPTYGFAVWQHPLKEQIVLGEVVVTLP